MAKDYTGIRIGNTVYIKSLGKVGDKDVLWQGKCDCGRKFIRRRSNISRTKTCGKCSVCNSKKYGKKLSAVYRTMKARCYSNKDFSYRNYGERGIRICTEWLKNSQMFFEWALDNGYREGLQIDRINNDGDYSPNNCRFATRSENCQNRRNNHLLTFKGVTLCLDEWSRRTGVKRSTLWMRLKLYNWPIEKALTV